MKKKNGSGSKEGNERKPPLPPITLPNIRCGKCRRDHPDRLILNSQEAAGYLRYTLLSLYSKKSRGELPPCVPGRLNPYWYACDLAYYLFPRSVSDLFALIAEKTKQQNATVPGTKGDIEQEIAKLKFELNRAEALAEFSK